MADVDLATALKQAKGKPMFFAFVGKGADGKLIVAKTKVPAKQIADAKKATSGSAILTGKCFGGDAGSMVFQMAKEAPASMAATFKKIAKRDAGITIDPVFQVSGDADAAAGDAVPVAANGSPVPASSPPISAPADAPPAPPAESQAQVDLSLWSAARQKAMTDLKALAAKVAATKNGSAAGVIKEIQSIFGKLPATPSTNDLDKLEHFVRTDDAITAAEEVPDHFHRIAIRGPLLQAIAAMK